MMNMASQVGGLSESVQVSDGSSDPARAADRAAPPIGAGTRLAYGFGAIANGVKSAAFTSYLMLYFNQVVGVPAAIVGLALAATLIVDAIVDPFLGRWSDVTRSRWGRRHPFIYGALIPTPLFFIMTWFPPAGMSDVAMGVWIFALSALTRVSISAFEITTSAMAPEMADDYRERTRLFSSRYFFGYVGAFGFTALSLWLIFIESPEYPQGQLNPQSYVGFALFGAALIFAAILVCGLGTHNRIPYLRQNEQMEASMPVGRHFREMLASFGNKAFLTIFGFGVFKYTAIGLYGATTLYFGTYLFKLTTGQLALLTFDSLVAAAIAAPLAPWFSEKIGKRASSMIFAVCGVAIGLSPLLLSYLDLFWVPGDPELVPALFLNGAIYGAMVAISLINTSAMLADVVEDSAVQTGRHTAGTFFAASSFMQQCSTALGLSIASAILAWSAFPAGVDPAAVTDEMTDSLLIHYIPTSFSLWSIGCLFLFFYPITKERHQCNVEILNARQAEALTREVQDAPLGAPAH
jgi:Na+/melibiose symporter-like transporter